MLKHLKKHNLISLLCLFFLLLYFHIGLWSVDVEFVDIKGVPNCYKVSKNLYRGGQPTEEGIKNLKELGIKTIVNLRMSNHDKKWVRGTNLQYYHFPTTAEFPSKRAFRRFLKIMSNPANYPVFVHCKHGADRTGTAVALYRIKFEHWAVEKAIDEMVNGGFKFHKIYGHLKRFIKRFQ